MAAPLLRGLPILHRLYSRHHIRAAVLLSPAVSRLFCSATTADEIGPEDGVSSPNRANEALSFKNPPRLHGLDDPDYRQWKDREAEILRDIEPITLLTKEILHSDSYMDGQRLTTEDEKVIIEKLLAYHPHSEDKIGCGLDGIMVDGHPQFRNSRCLFVVRTDGGWIDFSYQKCLRAYIRKKYPSVAERFIRKHYKRGSS